MEISAFAERVLFSETLEEKLAAPSLESLTDAHAGRALATPSMPGRPVTLRFEKDSRARRPLPGAGKLNDAEERGALLHFFANHELLAAELMALVLLKFPEAPAAFRMGVAKTLIEEQMHTRLYLRRMRECGVTFGSQPVNGFFWRSVSTMESPADYVARLSLTFEQANLDYSRHFAKLFSEAGDSATARILSKIYEDEISHVGYGLHWFRKWKTPNQSDWESYQSHLSFPLSPSRAKGAGVFNREARYLAGLDEDFVSHLELFSQSKGRTPNVYHFNPQAEWSIADRGEPNKTLTRLARDLSSLSLYLARRDDVALVEPPPSSSFLKKLVDAGIELPEIRSTFDQSLRERKLNELRPWGWSPDSAAYFGESHEKVLWREEWAALYSKAYSTEVAQRLGWTLGKRCRSLKETLDATGEIPRPCVFKSPLGLAGKGMKVLREGEELTDHERAWISHTLNAEGVVIVEPWLQRAMDFSVQYQVLPGGEMRLLGYTRLHNDRNGKFLGCAVHKKLTYDCDDAVTRLFYSRERAVQQPFELEIPRLLSPRLAELGFEGALGVDSMIYRTSSGTLAHCPVVEINPRFTMGRMTLELARYVVKGTHARFRILTKRHLKMAKAPDFDTLAAQFEMEAPLRFEHYQNGHQRIASGALILNDPSQAEACLGILEVGKDLSPLT